VQTSVTAGVDHAEVALYRHNGHVTADRVSLGIDSDGTQPCF
jgi:hypothetical protein